MPLFSLCALRFTLFTTASKFPPFPPKFHVLYLDTRNAASETLTESTYLTFRWREWMGAETGRNFQFSTFKYLRVVYAVLRTVVYVCATPFESFGTGNACISKVGELTDIYIYKRRRICELLIIIL